MLPEEVEHWSLMTLREKLIKIGVKIVRHGRYVTFQLAEVAIPRTLFAEILRLIDGLRPRVICMAGGSCLTTPQRPGFFALNRDSPDGSSQAPTMVAQWASEHESGPELSR